MRGMWSYVAQGEHRQAYTGAYDRNGTLGCPDMRRNICIRPGRCQISDVQFLWMSQATFALFGYQGPEYLASLLVQLARATNTHLGLRFQKFCI